MQRTSYKKTLLSKPAVSTRRKRESPPPCLLRRVSGALGIKPETRLSFTDSLPMAGDRKKKIKAHDSPDNARIMYVIRTYCISRFLIAHPNEYALLRSDYCSPPVYTMSGQNNERRENRETGPKILRRNPTCPAAL